MQSALTVPTVADRLLQKAVARILEAVFEADFRDVSYGYRPGRSPHQALHALREQIRLGWVNYVYEADIRGYFNHICHLESTDFSEGFTPVPGVQSGRRGSRGGALREGFRLSGEA